MGKTLGTLAFILVVIATLAGEAAAQTRGGKLLIGRPTDAISLDSNAETTGAGSIVYWNIIEPLIYVAQDGQIKTKLASEYQVVAPDRVRFKLRKGIKFHDGTPFNAEAVKFTFNRAADDKQPARWKALYGPLKGAEVVDEYTVDVMTTVPFGPIVASTAMCYTGIVSPEAVKKFGENYGRNPVGTGPFKFKEWQAKNFISIVRNEDYWGEKVYLDEVVFKVIPEGGARMMAVKAGDLDMVVQPVPSELPGFRKDAKFTVAEAMGGRIIYLGFNFGLAPTNDPKVRQALSMAVNVPAIVENIMEGAAVPAKGYLAPSVFGFKDMDLGKRYAFNPQKARALLAEAGWKPGPDGMLAKDGQKLTLKFLGAKARFLMDAEICEAVQAQWKEIGVDVKLEFFDWATTFGLVRKPELPYNCFMMGWVTTNNDADYSLYSMFHSSQLPPTGWNSNVFKDPQVDKLLEEARVSADRNKRSEAYHQIQDTLAASAAWVPIYNTKEIFVLNKKVKGFVPESIEYQLTLGNVWLEK
jgi:peptide/nickel transport system substrate-binding protein